MNLILAEPAQVSRDGIVHLDGRAAKHVVSVLRAEPGRTIRVGIVDGPIGVGIVTGVTAGRVTLDWSPGIAAPPPPVVDLLLALPRPKVIGRLFAPLAALGVRRIWLTNAARVERDYFDTHVLDPATYRPLLLEGLEQACDTRVPIVSVHRRFRVLLEDELADAEGDEVRVCADVGPLPRVPDLLARHAGVRRAFVAIGPEGGWNDFERGLLESRGFVRATLGPRILRTDTVCAVVLGLVSQALTRPDSAS